MLFGVLDLDDTGVEGGADGSLGIAFKYSSNDGIFGLFGNRLFCDDVGFRRYST